MIRYRMVVLVLNSLANVLLLCGIARVTGTSYSRFRLAMASLLGGIYSMACTLSGFSFLNSMLWKIVFLILVVLAAFGMVRSSIRSSLIFCLLRLAFDGTVRGGFHIGNMAISVLFVYFLCRNAFESAEGSCKILPCRITVGGREFLSHALLDNGNTLRDPITGEQVFVAGADLASLIVKIPPEQLADPVETVRKLPKARLIPCKTVGTASALLPAIRLDRVQIGSWQGSPLVALSPVKLSEKFQLLTGGVLG